MQLNFDIKPHLAHCVNRHRRQLPLRLRQLRGEGVAFGGEGVSSVALDARL